MERDRERGGGEGREGGRGRQEGRKKESERFIVVIQAPNDTTFDDTSNSKH